MSVLAGRPVSWIRVIAVALIVPMGGCDSANVPPTTPTPPSALPPPSLSISGQVFEVTPGGRVPAPDIPMWVIALTGDCPATILAGCRVHFLQTASGADGRYAYPDLPVGTRRVLLSSRSEDYRQTCGASASVTGETRLDLEITSSLNPQPSPSPTPLVITGQVYEMTPTGRVGLGGAGVGMDYPVNDLWFHGVDADAEGRYTLCGVPAYQKVGFWAWAEGHEDAFGWLTFTSDTTLDIELRRESR